MSCAAAQDSQPRNLSQYAPLNASRWSTFGENSAEREIRRLLLRLPCFGVFDYLAYSVDGGLVSLYGKVVNPELKSVAQATVMTIGGVYHVNNQIRLLPHSPADNHIRLAVFGTIYGDRHLTRGVLLNGSIHIVVEGGAVDLEGEVATDAERRRALELARAVHGVSVISNHLTVPQSIK